MCAYAMPIVEARASSTSKEIIIAFSDKGPGKTRLSGSRLKSSTVPFDFLTYTPWGEQRSLSCVVLYFHQHDFAIRSQDFPSTLVFRAGTLVCVVTYVAPQAWQLPIPALPQLSWHSYSPDCSTKRRLLSHIIMIFVQGSKILTRGGAPPNRL